MKLSDYVIAYVADQGVKHIFTLPGGGCMHLIDSVGRCERLQYVCNLHEQACAIAADAYAQYTNNLGVALVTTGPGGTNTITGLAGAWLDSTPVLYLSGQVKRADLMTGRGVRQMGFQEIDIVRVVTSLTKYAVTVTDPSSIRYHLEKAVYLARHGRPGPVWIDIPLDVQAAQIDPVAQRGFDPSELGPSPDPAVLRNQVSEIVRLLHTAERPVFLAGNGIRLADGLREFERVIDRLGVPVLLTWKAIDFLPEDHPLYAGRPGAVASRGANFTLQNADLLISVGARLDLGQTGYNHRNFARGARKVIVDIDDTEIRKLDCPVELGVVADARGFLTEMLSQGETLQWRDRSGWLAMVRDWKTHYPIFRPEYWQAKDGVSNYVLLEVLGQEMTGEDVFVPGSSGACSEVTMQAFPVKAGMRVFNTEGLGPMGFAVPAALGGCLASRRRRTVSIDGDGGFQMNTQELETIRRLDLPIKFFVLNNDGYVSIQSTQKAHFQGRFVASNPGSGLTLPDTRKLAAAYGIRTDIIRTTDEVQEGVQRVLSTPGPVVCEVIITPEQTTSPRIASAQRPDGSMVSKPLEDLWPFLERDELKKHMIIQHIDNS